jgi:hypothetical protein
MNRTLELGPNILEFMPESLEEGDETEGTHKTLGTGTGDADGEDVEGEEVEGEDTDDGGVEGVKRTLVVFRFGVRYPGIRGKR